ncbi:nuclear transport factor 2 family protein [Candidatus Poriferisodalis sp.]|uniref:nuclear transport factor 2 family protein n=1 Tax=Candidatus Poriferisodalis sp. TaxID=3101277 RepID=UPI003B52B4F9
MESAQTRALLERYYAALTTADRDAMLECLDPEVTWVLPETAAQGNAVDTMSGAKEVVEALGGRVVRQTFDISQPISLEVRRMIVDGGTAVVQQRLTATAKATGREYDNQYCWVYDCRGGLIAHMEEYTDTLYAAQRMGWDLGV